MLISIDLSPRQAARMLAQAVRTRAKLEIEPRPHTCASLLWGTLAAREQDLLRVALFEGGSEFAAGALVGAMCDVRMILSGHLCMFSTFVAEVSNTRVPPTLLLAVPEVLQIANRRRFARHSPTEPVAVQVRVPAIAESFTAALSNIGPSGLACRVTSEELWDRLFIGDELELAFALPWSEDVFHIRAVTCAKSGEPDEGPMTVRFEFVPAGFEEPLQRLRAGLNEESARLTQSEDL